MDSFEVFTTDAIHSSFTAGQKNLLKALNALISSESRLLVTSTNIDYLDRPRTMQNGPNHVKNQAIDVIICDSTGEFDEVFNYSRSLLIWKFIHDLLRNYPTGISVCIEDDHLHFHCLSGGMSSNATLQSLSNKQKHNPNGSYFCDCTNGIVKKDVTKVLHYLFSN